jgi:hypothetical protein
VSFKQVREHAHISNQQQHSGVHCARPTFLGVVAVMVRVVHMCALAHSTGTRVHARLRVHAYSSRLRGRWRLLSACHSSAYGQLMKCFPVFDSVCPCGRLIECTKVKGRALIAQYVHVCRTSILKNTHIQRQRHTIGRAYERHKCAK